MCTNGTTATTLTATTITVTLNPNRLPGYRNKPSIFSESEFNIGTLKTRQGPTAEILIRATAAAAGDMIRSG